MNKVNFDMIKEMSFEEGSKALKDAGYVESYQVGDSDIYDYSSDTVFTLYDENDEVIHQLVYAEYYNKNEDFAGDDDYDGTEDRLMMAKWEEI